LFAVSCFSQQENPRDVSEDVASTFERRPSRNGDLTFAILVPPRPACAFNFKLSNFSSEPQITIQNLKSKSEPVIGYLPNSELPGDLN